MLGAGSQRRAGLLIRAVCDFAVALLTTFVDDRWSAWEPGRYLKHLPAMREISGLSVDRTGDDVIQMQPIEGFAFILR